VTGLVQDEFGYTSLIELESIERPFGLTIERDLDYAQKQVSLGNKSYGVLPIISSGLYPKTFLTFSETKFNSQGLNP